MTTGREYLGYALMGMGGGLTGKDVLGTYVAQQLQQKQAEQEYVKWQREQEMKQAELDASLATKGYLPSNEQMSAKDAINIGSKQYRYDPSIAAQQAMAQMEAWQKFGGMEGQNNTTQKDQTKVISSVADLVPPPTGAITQVPYMTPKGGGMKSITSPDYNAKMDVWKKRVGEVSALGEGMSKLASVLQDVRTAIDNSPDFKEGALKQAWANINEAGAKISKPKWYTDYETAVNQSFMPVMQEVLGASKVLSDKDLVVAAKALASDVSIPKKAKYNALEKIESILEKRSNAFLSGAGVKPEDFTSLYPETKSFFGGKVATGTDDLSQMSDEELRRIAGGQ